MTGSPPLPMDTMGALMDRKVLEAASSHVPALAAETSRHYRHVRCGGAQWLRLWHCSIVQRDLEQRDCCKPWRNTRHLLMVVGGWSEPVSRS